MGDTLPPFQKYLRHRLMVCLVGNWNGWEGQGIFSVVIPPKDKAGLQKPSNMFAKGAECSADDKYNWLFCQWSKKYISERETFSENFVNIFKIDEDESCQPGWKQIMQALCQSSKCLFCGAVMFTKLVG